MENKKHLEIKLKSICFLLRIDLLKQFEIIDKMNVSALYTVSF